MKKECENCKTELVGRWLPNKRFCNRKCYNSLMRKKRDLINERMNVPSSVVGAIAEYRVCIDLLLKGFDVFKNISLQGRCDLVIVKERSIFAVEVTTGVYSLNGKLSNPKKYVEKRWDILAIVTSKGEIFYDPPLPTKE